MNSVKKVQQEADGAVFAMGTGTLRLEVCSDSIIHVLYSPAASSQKRTDFVAIKKSWPSAKFTVDSTEDAITLSTFRLKVTVTRKDGAISYAEANGAPLVEEATRRMTAVKVNGEDTHRSESFLSVYGSHEGFYG
jgi:alpha-D-xyloside xylohydrolase